MKVGLFHTTNLVWCLQRSLTIVWPSLHARTPTSARSIRAHARAAVAHAAGKEDEHKVNQLRHEGTRVLPVFVLALQNHPEDAVLNNRQGAEAHGRPPHALLPRCGSLFFCSSSSSHHQTLATAATSSCILPALSSACWADCGHASCCCLHACCLQGAGGGQP